MRTMFVAFAFVMLVVSCATARKNAIPEEAWINNMHRLSAAHLYIFPKAADQRKFSDPHLRPAISGVLRTMAETASVIANDPHAPESDPLIRFTAGAFAADLRTAYSSFEQNDPQFARFVINRSTRYCIGCHTRADRGVHDFKISWNSELNGLSSAQKIEFFLANRRYQSALNEAKLMSREDELARRDPRTWLLAIERTLGMVIRVNNSPGEAEELALLAFGNKAAPNYARREAMVWLRDIREWKAEKRKDKADQLQIAINLIKRRPSFVRSLRATAILHGILENSKSSDYAEAMLYSGITAGSMRELNMGELDQYYYEACIGRAPHTELAERCYGKLEESVRASNPMMSLDPDLAIATQSRLADLRKASEVWDLDHDAQFMRREEFPEPENEH